MNERKNALHPFTAQQKKLMEDHYGLLQWFLSFGWVEQKDSDGSSEKVPFSLLEKEDVYNKTTFKIFDFKSLRQIAADGR